METNGYSKEVRCWGGFAVLGSKLNYIEVRHDFILNREMFFIISQSVGRTLRYTLTLPSLLLRPSLMHLCGHKIISSMLIMPLGLSIVWMWAVVPPASGWK
jgi:hypothetical protein